MTDIAARLAAAGVRYLGSFTTSEAYGISLSCHHCGVRWTGCAAESFCPECGRPKGFYADDRDKCYCDECLAALEATDTQEKP